MYPRHHQNCRDPDPDLRILDALTSGPDTGEGKTQVK